MHPVTWPAAPVTTTFFFGISFRPCFELIDCFDLNAFGWDVHGCRIYPRVSLIHAGGAKVPELRDEIKKGNDDA
jgi:hypothetical protein